MLQGFISNKLILFCIFKKIYIKNQLKWMAKNTLMMEGKRDKNV